MDASQKPPITNSDIVSVSIESELKQSYLDYAMSVIVSRALPDVRDGLKPVHRRVLYAMDRLGNDWNKPYKKSARIVGDVMGKYHPHGDSSIYDTIVRMAQHFSMQHVLIDGQGNFGSIDGDDPAAMRYTEIRLTKLAHALLADLDKETVEFRPNYDNNDQEPVVLPTRVPNLLVNGSSGIAVGMATNIPPHNLSEVIDACIALLDRPDIEIEQLIHYLPGPDFPTAATIQGRGGILEAYRTGRGQVTLRAVSLIEQEKSGKQKIVVTELPYQVNKAKLLEKIAELVKARQIEGITTLRDESDREGIRIVIEVRRGDIPEIVLNNLYAQTALQSNFNINIVALREKKRDRLVHVQDSSVTKPEFEPARFNLKQLLDAFLQHRREVVTRRTLFELRKAKERIHILEGLMIAISQLDPIIALIKAARDPADAKQQLLGRCWPISKITGLLLAAQALTQEKNTTHMMGVQSDQQHYQLSPIQAQAILDLRLHRLTSLEQDKLLQDYQAQIDQIKSLLKILSDPDTLNKLIHEDLLAIKKEFSEPRRTRIEDSDAEIQNEDLIPKEDVVITLSHEGYIKTQSLTVYQAQRRGGKGKVASGIKEEDFIEQLVIAHSHETLLCFSSLGRVYWLKAYQLPQGSRTARGRPIVNLLPLKEEEKIHALLPLKDYGDGRAIFMATAQGTVKKTPLVDFSRPRNGGINAIDLQGDDRLIGVALTNGQQDVLLFTDAGKVIRFQESQVRAMGRTARGVRGVKLSKDQQVISLIIPQPDSGILTATEKGYGKRTPIKNHRLTGRGGQGVVAIKTNVRNGKVVAALSVVAQDEVMLITNKANLVRLQVSDIRSCGRNSQGVRLMRLDGTDESLVALQRIAESLADKPHE
jgi:DNA gyrase subunit A